MEQAEQFNEADRLLWREQWYLLAEPYGSQAVAASWDVLQAAYTESTRHYHNLTHVQALLHWAEHYQAQLPDYDAVRFAIWYHDVVYQTRNQDNEERSAGLAEQELLKLNVPPGTIQTATQLIRATKTHQTVGLPEEGRWFLDFDLSILGSAPDVYHAYSQAIRREYSWVPEPLYRQGRRQVLGGFLERGQLFFTEALRQQLEAQARENLRRELAELN